MTALLSSEFRKCLGAVAVVAIGLAFEPSAARAQGLTVAAVGLLWIAFPPSVRLPSPWRWVLGLLVALPLLALLPLGAWDPDDWRKDWALTGNVFPLLTPQPWVVVFTWVGYVATLAFAVWLILVEWTERQRQWLAWALGGLALGVMALLVARDAGILPVPHAIESGLGPFPSRNQSGLFFAIASLWWLFLGAQSVKRRHRLRAIFCVLAAVACGVWTVANGSRAGVGFLALGMLLQCALGTWGMARGWRVGGVALLAGIACFAFFVMRDLPAFQRGEGGNRSFRQAVQMDTLDLILDSPVVGIGLGNYEAVFAFYRTRSASEYRARHAENDWLHAAAETGIPATLLLALVGIVLMAIVARQLRRDPSPLKVTVAIALLLFAIHLVWDQSGHAPGILLWLLLMGSLLFPMWGTASVSRKSGRVIGVGLVAMAALLAVGIIPRECVYGLAEGVNFQPGKRPTLAELEAALVIRPLSWELHEIRAHQLAQANRWDEAAVEFQMAKRLEPFSTALAQREIHVFRRSPHADRTAAAIDDLLRRVPEAERPAFLDAYLNDARKVSGEVEDGGLDFRVIRWRLLDEGELRQRLVELTPPSVPLTAYAEAKLAALALQVGGVVELEKVAVRVGGLKPPTWKKAAEALAASGDYRAADWIVIEHLLPRFSESASLEERLREWRAAPGDSATALALARAYLRQGSSLSARRVIDRVPIQGEAGRMGELYRGWADYLEGNYQEAWTRLSQAPLRGGLR